MLFANNLQVNGNDEQRATFLPKACTGEHIGGMCMSEPGAGTDVLGMSTTAQLDGDSYVLNGAKMWITNGALDDDTMGDIFSHMPGRAGADEMSASSWLRETIQDSTWASA